VTNPFTGTARRLAPVIVALAVVALVGCDSGSDSGSPSSSDRVRPSTTTTRTRPAPAPSPTTLPADPQLAALRGHTVVVDAGHNGGNASHAAEISRPIFIGTQNRACDTTGTQTASRYPEHAYTLDIALRLRDQLTTAGANVVMVRTDDAGWGPCIDERAYIGNRAGAEAGISIHADGGPTSGRGFHVNMPADIPGYTDDIYAASHALGLALRDAYVEGTGIPPSDYIGSNGLTERRDFGGLNLSDVPKVLFETGNMRNPTDAALLENADVRARIARALAVGLSDYFAGETVTGPR
jgi:N-acetylmuramoyl-L-alanine amidase